MLSITNYSVQFSHSVVSDSLWPHELQYTRPPCTMRYHLSLLFLEKLYTLNVSQSVFHCPSFSSRIILFVSVYAASWVNSSVCVQSLSHVFLFVAPWTIAHQASLSMEFSRQEYLNGLPFSAPGDLPKPGMEPISFVSPALAGKLFSTVPLGSLNSSVTSSNSEILLFL